MEIFSGSACHKEKTFDNPQRLATPCVERCFCENALRQSIGCKRDFISLAAVIFSTVREACVVAFGTTLSFAKRQRSCRVILSIHLHSEHRCTANTFCHLALQGLLVAAQRFVR